MCNNHLVAAAKVQSLLGTYRTTAIAPALTVSEIEQQVKFRHYRTMHELAIAPTMTVGEIEQKVKFRHYRTTYELVIARH